MPVRKSTVSASSSSAVAADFEFVVPAAHSGSEKSAVTAAGAGDCSRDDVLVLVFTGGGKRDGVGRMLPPVVAATAWVVVVVVGDVSAFAVAAEWDVAKTPNDGCPRS